MSAGIELFYLNQQDETVHRDWVALDELFLRKLVDATMVRNRLWEHEYHENNEFKQAAIYVNPWQTDATEEDAEEIYRAVHERFDVSTHYEILWYVREPGSYRLLRTDASETVLRTAGTMLDHAHLIDGMHYDVNYSVLDLDRRKLLVFLQKKHA